MIHYQEQAYWFQFWPPQGEAQPFEVYHKLSDTQVSEHPWLSSPYFHWWRFLRESDAYKGLCIDARLSKVDDEVYRYFGDICASDNFWTWWLTKGCELFCEPRSHSPHTVDWANVDDMLEESRGGRRLLVSLSLEGDLERTKAEVIDLLKRLGGKEPTRSRKDSKALFQIFGDPKPLALDKYYRVWRCRRDNPEMANADIAFECGLKKERVTGSADRTDVSNDVKRMIGKAQSIIDHVHLGVFPVLDKKAAKNIKQHLSDRLSRSKLRREEIGSERYTNPVLAYGGSVEPIYLMEAS